jgi:hypothetical protein
MTMEAVQQQAAAEAPEINTPQVPLEHPGTLMSLLEQATSSWAPQEGSSYQEVWSHIAAAAANPHLEDASRKQQQLQSSVQQQQQQLRDLMGSDNLAAGTKAGQPRLQRAVEGKDGASDSMLSDRDLLGLEAALVSAAVGYERMGRVCSTGSGFEQLLLAASPPLWPDKSWATDMMAARSTITPRAAADTALPSSPRAGNSSKQPRQQITGLDGAAATSSSDWVLPTAMADSTRAPRNSSYTLQASAAGALSPNMQAFGNKSAGSVAKRRKITKSSSAIAGLVTTADGAQGASRFPAEAAAGGFASSSEGAGRAATAAPGLAIEECLAAALAADALLALNNSR